MERNRIGVWILTAIAGAVGAVFLYPFAWMFVSSFKSNPEIFDPRAFWPARWDGAYFGILVSGEYFGFWRSLGNSLAIALIQSVGGSLIAASAGFAIGTGRFRGRLALLGIGALAIIVPTQIVALPLFVWMSDLGLFDTVFAVALPGLASGIGLLYFEKVFRQIPRDLLDLGRTEGASEKRLFLIVLPLVRPHLVAFGFVSFALSWHAYIVPLLVLHSQSSRTLPLALSALYGGSLQAPVAVLMAGSSVCMGVLAGVFALAFPFMRTALKEFMQG